MSGSEGGTLKRKADGKAEGERSPKRPRGPDSPSKAPRSSGTDRSEVASLSVSSEASRSSGSERSPRSERGEEPTVLPAPGQLPATRPSAVGFAAAILPALGTALGLPQPSAPASQSQQEPASNQLIYSSWDRRAYREETRLFMNRDFEGYVRIANSRTGLFRAPYRTTGDGVYTSDLVGQFSTPTGYVTAQVRTTFRPWPSAPGASPAPQGSSFGPAFPLGLPTPLPPRPPARLPAGAARLPASAVRLPASSTPSAPFPRR
jgi:hypothetical protein